MTLQWHGDTFDLPDGAELLATSPLARNQAFRGGELAYGVQFHLEVTGDMAREWGAVPAYRASLARDARRGGGRGLPRGRRTPVRRAGHAAETLLAALARRGQREQI